MKKFLLIALLGIAINLSAQETIKEIVKQGTVLHDAGNYDSAILIYQKALKIDPGSLLANYEISLSYMYNGVYEKAIEHSDFIIGNEDTNDRYMLTALMNKGSSLDALGKPEEAVSIFKKALEINSENYLLHYNLALTYSNLDRNDAAVNSAVNAISLNPNHGSSHLLLGYIMKDEGSKVQSILALHFFLFLEPNSGRSPGALSAMLEQFGGNVKKTGKNELQLLMGDGSLDDDNEFSSAELMLSMMAANNQSKKNKNKSEMELFVENTDTFFSILGELKEKDEDNTGLWWEFYVPFGYKLVNSDHLETYCHYIQLSTNQASRDWIKDHNDQVEAFSNWLGSN